MMGGLGGAGATGAGGLGGMLPLLLLGNGTLDTTTLVLVPLVPVVSEACCPSCCSATELWTRRRWCWCHWCRWSRRHVAPLVARQRNFGHDDVGAGATGAGGLGGMLPLLLLGNGTLDTTT